VDVVTICAVNYLPFAEVLGNSFLDTNSNCSFSIFVIDDYKFNYLKNPRFKYYSPKDLDVPENKFLNMAFYYEVTELATALKPSVLKMMFNFGSSEVVYLDPDIQVFGELQELKDALKHHSIVLTPHTLFPIPRDGLRPSEYDILGSGTFNLGFIALKNSEISKQLLIWWEERLEFDSISDPEKMLFTDQRWIDFIPSYFPHYVLRSSAYNVAYWNLHERKLTKQENKTLVEDSELKFFHFSGFSPSTPWILSKYVADSPRVVISKSSVLRELCLGYANLLNKHGWNSKNISEYGFSRFESGKKIPRSLRRLYREDCIQAKKNGIDFKPPTNWQVWATTRSPDSGNLSRILFSLWKSRPDLQRRYPDATGLDAVELQLWAKTHGVTEGVIDKDLIEIGTLTEDAYPSEFSKAKGVNIAGYLMGEFGLGQSARIIRNVAITSGLSVADLNSNRAKVHKIQENLSSEHEKIYPIIISVVNADHFEFWIKDIGQDRIKNSIVIGVWAWETEDFPETMHKAFNYVDEIWAVSTFAQNAISKHTSKPVFVFPTPILAPTEIEKLNRQSLGLPSDREYNLFIFDYSSVFNRKNPDGLVEAHAKAFPGEDGPLLIIKSMNGDKDSANREKLRFICQNRSDIILLEDFIPRKQLTALINECLVYISLHRSEGYGLTLAEAMALGKPVIATNYSGNLDFMNDDNSILVPYKISQIGEGSFPYKLESFWANPDIEYAANQMKKLYTDGEFRRILGEKAEQSVKGNFNLLQAQQFLNYRVDYYFSFSSRVKKLGSKLRKSNKDIKNYLRSRIGKLLKSL